MLYSSSIAIGSAIPLVLQLFDGDDSKYPVAVVRNSTGQEVLGSPFLLTNVGEGHYTNFSFKPDSIGYYTATYIIFDDENHTTESSNHSRALDTYSVGVSITSLYSANATAEVDNEELEALLIE